MSEHTGPNLVPKVHPATRPVEPEDPMNLHGFELPGDPELMLRMFVEEYGRMGWDLEALMSLCRDPFYKAAHGLWLAYGEDELRGRLQAILARSGVVRVKTVAAAPPPQDPAPPELVQIKLAYRRQQ